MPSDQYQRCRVIRMDREPGCACPFVKDASIGLICPPCAHQHKVVKVYISCALCQENPKTTETLPLGQAAADAAHCRKLRSRPFPPPRLGAWHLPCMKSLPMMDSAIAFSSAPVPDTNGLLRRPVLKEAANGGGFGCSHYRCRSCRHCCCFEVPLPSSAITAAFVRAATYHADGESDGCAIAARTNLYICSGAAGTSLSRDKHNWRSGSNTMDHRLVVSAAVRGPLRASGRC